MVKMLIENGADVNAVDQDGNSALMRAADVYGKENSFTTHAYIQTSLLCAIDYSTSAFCIVIDLCEHDERLLQTDPLLKNYLL